MGGGVPTYQKFWEAGIVRDGLARQLNAAHPQHDHISYPDHYGPSR